MILLVDSGATNSNWKFMTSEHEFVLHRKEGINLSTGTLEDHDLDFDDVQEDLVEQIFFFGAGTGQRERELLLDTKLKNKFVNVKSIYIGSDLETAGLALSQGEKCIISILGTGSNCCVFADQSIIKKVQNLGYLLGDEGSGFRMGRDILKMYFYGLMEAQDARLFEHTYKLTRDDLIRKVYHRGKKPNTYVASFCSFLGVSSQDLRNKIARQNLEDFFKDQIGYFKESSQCPLHFSGSISWHFKDIIQDLCTKYGYKLGNIIQNPIDSLTYSKLIEL
ncbi:hypothetical protein [Portibacter marinus]|uniref:hypothetical protein n=1 Tax=Portibacter marinus TaxID=2898660 RepID=UPI001F3B48E2|nr:hypothetical protein [Portibacter marinus]